MRIIPVIDIKHGVAVQAIGGRRESYQPVVSTVCKSANPTDLIPALLSVFPFSIIYIADLDALEKDGNATRQITEIAQCHKHIEFWVDAGLSEPSDLAAYQRITNIQPILASEAITGLEHFKSLCASLDPQEFILSLDHRGAPLGADWLFKQPEYWPRRVIVMDLENVGENRGPNSDLIRSYQDLSRATEFVAAGGVRDIQDLKHLRAQGVAGALIASALHRGSISGDDLRALE